MAPIPSCDTQAGPILTLAVQFAPGVTLFALAELSSPAGFTDAPSVLATSVGAAVEVAQADGAVLACPAGVTRAGIATGLD
jgi:hypothetical protein